MAVVLVTGASGFIGRGLVLRLKDRHSVIALSRRDAEGAAANYRGNFASFEDLRQLDDVRIDVAVHLAAEIGGTSEEDGLAVNVLGTRRLVRYLLERGCRRFVLASSIAAAGCLNADFVPEALPIPARHPCMAKDAYGLSKFLMEGLADYFARLHGDAEFVSLRLGAVIESNDPEPDFATTDPPPHLPFLAFGLVGVADVLAAFEAIVESKHRPGSRVYNVVGPDLRTFELASDVLLASLKERGDGLDLAPYAMPGHLAPPVYSMRELDEDYGFRPIHPVGAV